jgi:tetratricopeptide (TPR) repeat protein
VLVREVAYRGIPKTDRADLHERAARGLDRRDGADELVGYHFEQAFTYLTELSRDDEHTRELAAAGGERLGYAGIRAWKRADAPAAVNLLSRALNLVPEALEFGCELGVALRMRGEHERAQAVLEEVVASSRSGEPRLESRARLELAHVKALTDPSMISDVLAVAEEAIPIFESAGDERALGRAWLLVGDVRGSYYCDNAAWAEAAANAVDHYRQAGWSPSVALGNLGSALYCGATPVSDALRECRRLLEGHAGDRASEANLQLWMGLFEAMQGSFDTGRSLVADAQGRWDELGQSQGTISCGFAVGVIEMLAGNAEAAEEALRLSCAAAEKLHEPAQLANRSAELADALYAQGRYEEAEFWCIVAARNSAADDRSAQAAWRGASAKLRARLGAIAEGEDLAREEVAFTTATDSLLEQARSFLDLGEVLQLANRLDEADDATRTAVRLLEQKGNTVGADRARGHLAVPR